MADMIAKLAQVGYDGDKKVVGSAADRLREKLNLRADEWDRLLSFAADKRKSIEQFFEFSG